MKRSLLQMSLLLSAFACGEDKKSIHEEQQLRRQLKSSQNAFDNAQKDLERKDSILAAVNQKQKTQSEAASKMATLYHEANNARAVAIAAAGVRETALLAEVEKVKDERDKLRESNASLEAAKLSAEASAEERAVVVRASVSNLWGLYYDHKEMITIDKSKCRHFYYMEESGDSTQALICEDGHIQYTKFALKSVEAKVKDGALTAEVRSDVTESSCRSTPVKNFSNTQFFDRSARAGANSLNAILLETELSAEKRSLVSTALELDSNECEGIFFRAQNTSGLTDTQRSILNMSVRMCELVEKKISPKDTGCFESRSNGQFVR